MALVRLQKFLAESGVASRRKSEELIDQGKVKVNGRVAFDGYRAGDGAAREVVEMYLEYLASGLASMINIFQPEVLSIGGGISGEGQFLVDLVFPMIDKERYGGDFIEKKTEIRIAELGNDAGIVGAAFLGI